MISNRPAKELIDFIQRSPSVFHHIVENRRDDDVLIVDIEKIAENEGYADDVRKIGSLAVGKSLISVLECRVPKRAQHQLRARLQLRSHPPTPLSAQRQRQNSRGGNFGHQSG